MFDTFFIQIAAIMQSTLSPSDLVHGVIISHLIFSTRDKVDNQWSAMLVLCYLSETVGIPTSKQYPSFADLSQNFNTVVKLDNGLEEIWQSMLRIVSVDDFSRLVESMRNALIPNASINFNGLSGPSLITPDSNLRMFLRSVLARWV